MNPNSDFEQENPLLDAILKDERWQITDAAGKAEALAAFQARQRLRRLRLPASCFAVLVAAIAFGTYWLQHPIAAPPHMAAHSPEAPKKPENTRELTDGELVASFPAGSCFLAEIDGKKTLVFLDPQVERRYVASAVEAKPLAPP